MHYHATTGVFRNTDNGSSTEQSQSQLDNKNGNDVELNAELLVRPSFLPSPRTVLLLRFGMQKCTPAVRQAGTDLMDGDHS